MKTSNQRRNKLQIRMDLKAHIASDGCSNDSETDSLYREWHGLDDDGETDLETVELWAFQVINDLI